MAERNFPSNLVRDYMPDTEWKFEQPDARPIPGDLYILRSNYEYRWYDSDGILNRLRIEKGFIFSASIPRVLWMFIRPGGLIIAGACCHDMVYRTPGVSLGCVHQIFIGGSWVTSGKIWTREEADSLFTRINRQAGMPEVKCEAAHCGVRACGWYAWWQNGRVK